MKKKKKIVWNTENSNGKFTRFIELMDQDEINLIVYSTELKCWKYILLLPVVYFESEGFEEIIWYLQACEHLSVWPCDGNFGFASVEFCW